MFALRQSCVRVRAQTRCGMRVKRRLLRQPPPLRFSFPTAQTTVAASSFRPRTSRGERGPPTQRRYQVTPAPLLLSDFSAISLRLITSSSRIWNRTFCRRHNSFEWEPLLTSRSPQKQFFMLACWPGRSREERRRRKQFVQSHNDFFFRRRFCATKSG